MITFGAAAGVMTLERATVVVEWFGLALDGDSLALGRDDEPARNHSGNSRTSMILEEVLAGYFENIRNKSG